MAAGTITAKWFNPTTAAYTTIGSYSNTGTQNFKPPSSGDWVLLLAVGGTPSTPTGLHLEE
jgi:hypothetical protein